MNSMQLSEMNLPIQGMTCGGCGAHVERALKALPGVDRVSVDITTKWVTVTCDPNQVELADLQQAVQDAGYLIPTGRVRMSIDGMTCISCAAHIQGALGDLPGTLDVSVYLTQKTADVTFIPELVSTDQMVRAIRGAGYQIAGVERGDSLLLSSNHSDQEPSAQSPTGFVRRFKSFLRRN